MPKTLVLVATLDTKGVEARYLKEQIEKHGVRTLVVDGGILGRPQWEAQVSREEVARDEGSAERCTLEFLSTRANLQRRQL